MKTAEATLDSLESGLTKRELSEERRRIEQELAFIIAVQQDLLQAPSQDRVSRFALDLDALCSNIMFRSLDKGKLEILKAQVVEVFHRQCKTDLRLGIAEDCCIVLRDLQERWDFVSRLQSDHHRLYKAKVSHDSAQQHQGDFLVKPAETTASQEGRKLAQCTEHPTASKSGSIPSQASEHWTSVSIENLGLKSKLTALKTRYTRATERLKQSEESLEDLQHKLQKAEARLEGTARSQEFYRVNSPQSYGVRPESAFVFSDRVPVSPDLRSAPRTPKLLVSHPVTKPCSGFASRGSSSPVTSINKMHVDYYQLQEQLLEVCKERDIYKAWRREYTKKIEEYKASIKKLKHSKEVERKQQQRVISQLQTRLQEVAGKVQELTCSAQSIYYSSTPEAQFFEADRLQLEELVRGLDTLQPKIESSPSQLSTPRGLKERGGSLACSMDDKKTSLTSEDRHNTAHKGQGLNRRSTPSFEQEHSGGFSSDISPQFNSGLEAGTETKTESIEFKAARALMLEELRTLQAKVSRLTNEAAAAKQNQADLNGQVAALQENLQAKQKEVDGYSYHLVELKSVFTCESNVLLNSAEAHWRDLVKGIEDRERQLQSEVHARLNLHIKSLFQLSQATSTAHRTTAVMRTQENELQAEIADLKAKLAKEKADRLALQAELKAEAAAGKQRAAIENLNLQTRKEEEIEELMAKCECLRSSLALQKVHCNVLKTSATTVLSGVHEAAEQLRKSCESYTASASHSEVKSLIEVTCTQLEAALQQQAEVYETSLTPGVLNSSCEEYAEALEDLRRHVIDLTAELHEKTSQITALELQLIDTRKLDISLVASRARQEQQALELKTVKASLREAEERVKSAWVTDEIRQRKYEDILASLSDQLEVKTREVEDLKTQNYNGELKLGHLQDQLKEQFSFESLDNAETAIEFLCDALALNRVTTLSSLAEAILTTLTQRQEALETANQELQTKQQEIELLKEGQYSRRAKDSQKQVQSIDRQDMQTVESLEGNSEKENSRLVIDNLTRQVKSLQLTIKQLELKNSALSDRMSCLQAEHSDLTYRSTFDLSKTNSRIQDLEIKTEGLEAELKVKTAMLDDFKRSRFSMSSSVRALEFENQKLKKSVETAKAKLLKAEDDKADLLQVVGQLEKQHDWGLSADASFMSPQDQLNSSDASFFETLQVMSKESLVCKVVEFEGHTWNLLNLNGKFIWKLIAGSAEQIADFSE
jgi:chromosome segregation ATPase